MNKTPNIALLSYNKNKYSETFIQYQAEHLKGTIHYLYGGDLPGFHSNGTRFLKNDLVSGSYAVFREKILGTTLQQQHLEAVEKYLVQQEIDLVLANYALPAFSVMDICERQNIPLIVHFHGWTAYRKSILDSYATQYAKLFKTAAAIIVVSVDMQKQLERLGAPPEKLHVARCGANDQLFYKTDHTHNPPVFFSAGRFCETKKPELTIKAFNSVLKTQANARLIMAGGDEGKLDTCLALVKQLGIEDKVEFKGAVPHNTVQQLMQDSAALVIHYATTADGEKEGTPVTVMEAALSGLPIVSTNHAGVGEVFEHNKTAMLSDELDVDSMAKNMLEVISNKPLAKNIAEAAFALVKNNYTSAMYIQKLDDIINRCLSRK